MLIYRSAGLKVAAFVKLHPQRDWLGLSPGYGSRGFTADNVCSRQVEPIRSLSHAGKVKSAILIRLAIGQRMISGQAALLHWCGPHLCAGYRPAGRVIEQDSGQAVTGLQLDVDGFFFRRDFHPYALVTSAGIDVQRAVAWQFRVNVFKDEPAVLTGSHFTGAFGTQFWTNLRRFRPTKYNDAEKT